LYYHMAVVVKLGSFLARLEGSETLPTCGLASEKHELKVHIQVQWKWFWKKRHLWISTISFSHPQKYPRGFVVLEDPPKPTRICCVQRGHRLVSQTLY
jgi:hypothetical protein